MIRCFSEHQAALESIRATYAELAGATAPLQDEAERVYIDVDTPDRHAGYRARHEMPVTKTTDFLQARRAFENATLANVILPQSLLVAMVSQHDAFMGGALRRSVGFGELQSMGGLDELRDRFIEEQIRDVLRQSHRAQLQWIADLLGMRIDSDPELLDRFREVVHRRHLYAHNAGIINAKYIETRAVVDPQFAGKPGELLELSAETFEQAFSTLFEIAVKLWQATWRKALPGDQELAEEALYRLGYDLLVFDDLKAARCVLEFSLTMHHYTHENIKRKNIVNLAQAHKWLGDDAACQRTLEGDWSASEESFDLAIAVLSDDFDRAEHLMSRIGAKGDIVEQAFRDWPLFREFRRTQQFARAYAELFDPAGRHRARRRLVDPAPA
jgi:hypothetical protein